jgi:hypothetical protein
MVASRSLGTDPCSKKKKERVCADLKKKKTCVRASWAVKASSCKPLAICLRLYTQGQSAKKKHTQACIALSSAHASAWGPPGPLARWGLWFTPCVLNVEQVFYYGF